MSKTYSLAAIMLFLTAASTQSCKKTQYEQQKSPYNEILVFKIAGSTGDSTKCLISGDSITIYWDPNVPMPENITPTIQIDEKAAISPASGQSVPFNKSTVFTVTSEDGHAKTYHLNPVLDIPLPSIAGGSISLTWLNDIQVYIQGQYFLAGTDTGAIKVYMKRVSDGVEFPLEVIKESVTNYTMLAQLPEYSANMDTGLHKLYVQIGSKMTNTVDVNFIVPYIANANPVSNMIQDGQAIHTGDVIDINYSFNDNYGGKIASYYKGNVGRVLFYTPAYDIITVTDIKVTDSTVKVTMPDLSKYVGKTFYYYRLVFNDIPADRANTYAYYLGGVLAHPMSIEAK